MGRTSEAAAKKKKKKKAKITAGLRVATNATGSSSAASTPVSSSSAALTPASSSSAGTPSASGSHTPDSASRRSSASSSSSSTPFQSQVLYWKGYVDPEGHSEAPEVKRSLERLFGGEIACLDFERLNVKGADVYSIRLSKKSRLIFTTLNEKLLILDLLPNHEYDSCKFLQEGVCKKYLQNKGIELDNLEMVKPGKGEKLPEFKYRGEFNFAPAYEYARQIVSLSFEQGEAMTKQFPMIITAPPGAGKTLWLTIYAQLHPKQEFLFVAQSPTLVRELEREYKRLGNKKNNITFKTYYEIVAEELGLLKDGESSNTSQSNEPQLVDYNDFCVWFNGIKNARALKEQSKGDKKGKKAKGSNDSGLFAEIQGASPLDIYREFLIISSLLVKLGHEPERDEYLRIGILNSMFSHCSDEFKVWVYETYRKYRDEYLSEESNRVNLEFYLPKSIKKYGVVLSDEMQDFSPVQMMAICMMAQNGNMVGALDPEQSLFASISPRPSLVAACRSVFRIEPSEVNFTGTFRCRAEIAKVAQQLMDIGNIAAGGTTDKIAYRTIESLDKRGSGAFRYVAKSQADYESLNGLIGALKGSGLAVITNNKDEAQKRYPDVTNVLTPKEAKGLEFDVVILDVEISQQLQDMNRALKGKQGESVKGRSKVIDHTFITDMHELYVSATRARSILIIASEFGHHAKYTFDKLGLTELTEKAQLESCVQGTTNSNEDWLGMLNLHIENRNWEMVTKIGFNELKLDQEQFIKKMHEVMVADFRWTVPTFRSAMHEIHELMAKDSRWDEQKYHAVMRELLPELAPTRQVEPVVGQVVATKKDKGKERENVAVATATKTSAVDNLLLQGQLSSAKRTYESTFPTEEKLGFFLHLKTFFDENDKPSDKQAVKEFVDIYINEKEYVLAKKIAKLFGFEDVKGLFIQHLQKMENARDAIVANNSAKILSKEELIEVIRIINSQSQRSKLEAISNKELKDMHASEFKQLLENLEVAEKVIARESSKTWKHKKVQCANLVGSFDAELLHSVIKRSAASGSSEVVRFIISSCPELFLQDHNGKPLYFELTEEQGLRSYLSTFIISKFHETSIDIYVCAEDLWNLFKHHELRENVVAELNVVGFKCLTERCALWAQDKGLQKEFVAILTRAFAESAKLKGRCLPKVLKMIEDLSTQQGVSEIQAMYMFVGNLDFTAYVSAHRNFAIWLKQLGLTVHEFSLMNKDQLLNIARRDKRMTVELSGATFEYFKQMAEDPLHELVSKNSSSIVKVEEVGDTVSVKLNPEAVTQNDYEAMLMSPSTCEFEYVMCHSSGDYGITEKTKKISLSTLSVLQSSTNEIVRNRYSVLLRALNLEQIRGVYIYDRQASVDFENDLNYAQGDFKDDPHLEPDNFFSKDVDKLLEQRMYLVGAGKNILRVILTHPVMQPVRDVMRKENHVVLPKLIDDAFTTNNFGDFEQAVLDYLTTLSPDDYAQNANQRGNEFVVSELSKLVCNSLLTICEHPNKRKLLEQLVRLDPSYSLKLAHKFDVTNSERITLEDHLRTIEGCERLIEFVYQSRPQRAEDVCIDDSTTIRDIKLLLKSPEVAAETLRSANTPEQKKVLARICHSLDTPTLAQCLEKDKCPPAVRLVFLDVYPLVFMRTHNGDPLYKSVLPVDSFDAFIHYLDKFLANDAELFEADVPEFINFFKNRLLADKFGNRVLLRLVEYSYKRDSLNKLVEDLRAVILIEPRMLSYLDVLRGNKLELDRTVQNSSLSDEAKHRNRVASLLIQQLENINIVSAIKFMGQIKQISNKLGIKTKSLNQSIKKSDITRIAKKLYGDLYVAECDSYVYSLICDSAFISVVSGDSVFKIVENNNVEELHINAYRLDPAVFGALLVSGTQLLEYYIKEMYKVDGFVSRLIVMLDSLQLNVLDSIQDDNSIVRSIRWQVICQLLNFRKIMESHNKDPENFASKLNIQTMDHSKLSEEQFFTDDIITLTTMFANDNVLRFMVVLIGSGFFRTQMESVKNNLYSHQRLALQAISCQPGTAFEKFAARMSDYFDELGSEQYQESSGDSPERAQQIFEQIKMNCNRDNLHALIISIYKIDPLVRTLVNNWLLNKYVAEKLKSEQPKFIDQVREAALSIGDMTLLEHMPREEFEQYMLDPDNAKSFVSRFEAAIDAEDPSNIVMHKKIVDMSDDTVKAIMMSKEHMSDPLVFGALAGNHRFILLTGDVIIDGSKRLISSGMTQAQNGGVFQAVSQDLTNYYGTDSTTYYFEDEIWDMAQHARFFTTTTLRNGLLSQLSDKVVAKFLLSMIVHSIKTREHIELIKLLSKTFTEDKQFAKRIYNKLKKYLDSLIGAEHMIDLLATIIVYEIIVPAYLSFTMYSINQRMLNEKVFGRELLAMDDKDLEFAILKLFPGSDEKLRSLTLTKEGLNVFREIISDSLFGTISASTEGTPFTDESYTLSDRIFDPEIKLGRLDKPMLIALLKSKFNVFDLAYPRLKSQPHFSNLVSNLDAQVIKELYENPDRVFDSRRRVMAEHIERTVAMRLLPIEIVNKYWQKPRKGQIHSREMAMRMLGTAKESPRASSSASVAKPDL